MTTDYPAYHKHLEERLAQFGKEMPGPMTGFSRLHKKSVEDGALNGKTKELMALAISVAVRCEGCIAYHVHDAVQGRGQLIPKWIVRKNIQVPETGIAG